jgi:hypothetical protein
MVKSLIGVRLIPKGGTSSQTQIMLLRNWLYGLLMHLGLTHSSQDWLLTREGPVFLETNPGGQWLFLEGSEQSVIPALVAHLRGRDAA